MSDIIVLETEMGGGQGEEKGWPVEVMVGVGEDGVITLLKRCACVCLAYHTSLSFKNCVLFTCSGIRTGHCALTVLNQKRLFIQVHM